MRYRNKWILQPTTWLKRHPLPRNLTSHMLSSPSAPLNSFPSSSTLSTPGSSWVLVWLREPTNTAFQRESTLCSWMRFPFPPLPKAGGCGWPVFFLNLRISLLPQPQGGSRGENLIQFKIWGWCQQNREEGNQYLAGRAGDRKTRQK